MPGVGFGIIGQGIGHSRSIWTKEAAGANLVAIADLIPARRERAEREFGVPAYEDYRKLLDRKDIDVIGIFTPAGARREIALDALAAGKNVICTKPMEVNIARCDDMIRAAKSAGRRLVVDFDGRYRKTTQAIRRAIDEGRFGRIFQAEVKLKWHRSQKYYDENGGWRGTWRLDGGGSLANQTIHYIDRIQLFMGPPASVFGYTGVYAHDIEAEDQGVAVIRWKNGALGTIVGATTTPPGFEFTRIEIHGEKGGVATMSTSGAYAADPKKGEVVESWLEIDPSGKTVRVEELPPVEGPKNIIEDVVSMLTRGTEPMTTGEEGRKSVEILNGIYESAETGREVCFPLAKPFIPKDGYRR